MIVEYAHKNYELEGSVNTENYCAHFMFKRKELASDDQLVILEHIKQRFLKRIGSIAVLGNFETIHTDDLEQTDESLNQPKIIISGLIISDPPESIYDKIPAAAMRALGQPLTPEIIERSIATSALQKCAQIVLSEFEGLMIKRQT